MGFPHPQYANIRTKMRLYIWVRTWSECLSPWVYGLNYCIGLNLWMWNAVNDWFLICIFKLNWEIMHRTLLYGTCISYVYFDSGVNSISYFWRGWLSLICCFTVAELIIFAKSAAFILHDKPFIISLFFAN